MLQRVSVTAHVSEMPDSKILHMCTWDKLRSVGLRPRLLGEAAGAHHSPHEPSDVNERT